MKLTIAKPDCLTETFNSQPKKPINIRLQGIDEVTPEDRIRALGPFAFRHGNVPKDTRIPDTIVLACPRVRVADLKQAIPSHWHEKPMAHNQQVAACCRQPENHDIAAFKSHKHEQFPDIYIFFCTCGRKHTRFILARTDNAPRPIWSAA